MITLAYLQVLLQLHLILNGWELQRLRGASPSYLRDGPPNLIYHKRKRSSHARDGDARKLRKFADQERTGDATEPTDAQHISCFLVPVVSLLRQSVSLLRQSRMDMAGF